ncbi:MAG: nitroreductase family protein [Candidatus Kapabacteria bacterium]|nr:nitroreductase family protein [Candidatus Kapabacteria bacterium]
MSSETITLTTTTDGIDLKRAHTVHTIHELLAMRWSPRSFAETPVSETDMNTILEAAAWAASGGNGQPWAFIYGLRGSKTFGMILSALNPSNQAWAQNAGALVLCLARVMNAEGKPSRLALHDTGSAMTTMLLQGTAMGIYGHPMGGYNMEQMREQFSIPQQYETAAVVAMGYVGSPDALSEHNRTREIEPRTRKPLADYAFSTSPF